MTSTSSLAGKRVLVTGGSSGIGAAIVRRLAAQGATSRRRLELTAHGGCASATYYSARCGAPTP